MYGECSGVRVTCCMLAFFVINCSRERFTGICVVEFVLFVFFRIQILVSERFHSSGYLSTYQKLFKISETFQISEI